MRSSRPGFSLIELLVALVVLVVGLAALAGGTARALRALADARLEEDAAARAARRLEWLRGLPCAARAGGSSGDGRLLERWTVATHGEGLATHIEVEVGPADGTSPPRVFDTVAPC